MLHGEQPGHTGDQPPVGAGAEYTGFNVDAVELVQVRFDQVPVGEQVNPLQPRVGGFAVRVVVAFA